MPAIIPTKGPEFTAMKRTFRSRSGKLLWLTPTDPKALEQRFAMGMGKPHCGELVVTHHDCPVVSFDPARTAVTLRNDGWQSVTTRQRINKALVYFGFPMALVSHKREWFVQTPYGEVKFVDGLRFTGDGFPLN